MYLNTLQSQQVLGFLEIQFMIRIGQFSYIQQPNIHVL